MKIITILCVIMLLYIMCCGIVFFKKKNIKYKYVDATDYYVVLEMLYREFDEECKPLKNNQYRELIENDFDLKFYNYKEKRLSNGTAGITFPVIRMIILDDRLLNEEYCVVFAHEAIHLDCYVADERWVCFETFKYLYKSENPKLHNAGVKYAIQQMKGLYREERDVYDLIVDYLTNK